MHTRLGCYVLNMVYPHTHTHTHTPTHPHTLAAISMPLRAPPSQPMSPYSAIGPYSRSRPMSMPYGSAGETNAALLNMGIEATETPQPKFGQAAGLSFPKRAERQQSMFLSSAPNFSPMESQRHSGSLISGRSPLTNRPSPRPSPSPEHDATSSLPTRPSTPPPAVKSLKEQRQGLREMMMTHDI